METVILVIHLLIAIAMVGVVLLQRSEGGALGIGGGGGGGGGGMSGLMSGRAAGDLLTRTTAILAVAFFTTSITLAILSGVERDGGSILDQQGNEQSRPAVPQEPEVPQAPAPPTGN